MMKHRVSSFVTGVLVSLCFWLAPRAAEGACTASATAGTIGTITIVPQVNEASCWAACGEMITKFLRLSCSQCSQLSHKCCASDPNACCAHPGATQCTTGGFIDFPFCGFSSRRTADGTALTWSKLKSEIYCERRPVAFSWHWVGVASGRGPGGGGHMMVAAKYANSTTTGKVVYIKDPDPVGEGDSFWIDYETYIEGEYHWHWSDDYEIRKN